MHYNFEPAKEERHIMSVDGAEILRWYDKTPRGYKLKPDLKRWINDHAEHIITFLSTVDEFYDDEDEDAHEIKCASVHFKDKDTALQFKLTFG